MSRARSIMLLSVLVTCAAAPAGRQAGGSIAAGTAIVSGQVLTDTATPQPVRRATVRLSGEGLASARLVGTDDEGRFAFSAMPAGRFTLSASKPGLVTTFHGSTRPGRGPGVPVAVAEGERVIVTLPMLAGAAITGVITDPSGRPLPGVPVAVVDSRSGAAGVVRGVTDDRGEYRVFSLAPGSYLVSAIPRLLPAAGRGLAGPAVVTAVTDADVRWARAGGSAAAPAPGRPVAYAPVYFPGTTDAGASALVTVGPGEERAGVSMTLRPVALAQITGVLQDANGQPFAAATVSLAPRRGDRPGLADALVASGALTLPRATVSAGGFSISGVAPGEYTLVARSGSGQRGAAAAPVDAAGPLWSVSDINVDGGDRDGLVLRMLPGVALSGSIVFEQGAAAPPASTGAIELSLAAINPLLGVTTASRVVVNQDWTFRIASIPPGSHLLRGATVLAADSTRWTLKSAMLGTRDLADTPFVATPGGDPVEGVIVTFTDRAAEISGRLTDAANRPVTRYSIIVLTTDRTMWAPNTRRIRAVRPATDGAFAVAGLPSGEYAIVAMEDVDDADLADPDLLSRLLASEVKVSIADGERRRQDLRVGGSDGATGR